MNTEKDEVSGQKAGAGHTHGDAKPATWRDITIRGYESVSGGLYHSQEAAESVSEYGITRALIRSQDIAPEFDALLSQNARLVAALVQARNDFAHLATSMTGSPVSDFAGAAADQISTALLATGAA